jgi:acetyl esterase/lipase
MKRNILSAFAIIVSVSFCFTDFLYAQTCTSQRYKQRVFPNVQKTADIQFATVQSLPSVYINETQTVSQNLFLDVWQPAGDTLQKRPLVILAYGGAFVLGTKNDADIQAACDSLAHLGYVTASIQYRLGLNPASTSSGERAVYRATQDYAAAVRYFKNFASLYKIDTSAIFAGGCSAGSFAAMHMAYGEDDERPASSYASGGLFPAPDLGCINCSGNSYPFSHKVRGVINMWGALGYLTWIEPNDPPIVSFHGDADPLVPYTQGFPFTVGATLPMVYGSAKIYERTQQLGIHHEFYTYQSALHQLWGAGLEQTWVAGPTEFQIPILNGIRLFLYNQLKPTFTQLSGPENACTGDAFWYQVPLRTGFRYCWQVQNGQILQVQNNQIRVRWNSPGTGQVSVREFNHLDFPADSFLIRTVSITPKPIVSVQGPTQLCAGDTATLTASGAASYQWNGGNWLSSTAGSSVQAWPSQNVSYSVYGFSSAGCADTATGTIAVSPAPVSPFITRIGNTLSVPPQYAAYQWFLDGTLIPGSTLSATQITANGVYTVLVSNTQGCDALSYPFSINNLSTVQNATEHWQVFPNPAREEIFIKGPESGLFRVEWTTVSGQKIKEEIKNAEKGIRLSVPLSEGLYLLSVSETDGPRTMNRLVVVMP